MISVLDNSDAGEESVLIAQTYIPKCIALVERHNYVYEEASSIIVICEFFVSCVNFLIGIFQY